MGNAGRPQNTENVKLSEYVKRVRENDDDDAFRHVVKALDGFLKHLSTKKFFIQGCSSDDVYQEGLFALSTKAIPDYCEDKGAFLGFAKLCIKRHIITVLKSANNNKNKALNGSVSLDATANNEEDGPVPISVMIPCDSESVSETFVRNESHIRLKALLVQKLTPLETEVLDHYLQNMSYMDIVSTMNKKKRGKNRVGPKVIDNALCRIKKKAIEIEADLGEDLEAKEEDDIASEVCERIARHNIAESKMKMAC